MTRARIRTIKPEFFEDEKIGALSLEARLAMVALMTLADDEGRLRAAPAYVRGQRYAYDPVTLEDVDGWLMELASAGRIALYDVRGDRYAEILGWSAHQKIDRPSKSKIPAPSEGIHVVASVPRESSRNVSRPREASRTFDAHTSDHGPWTPTVDPDRGPSVGTFDNGGVPPVEPALIPDPPVIELPLQAGKVFGVTEGQLRAWVTDFPTIDVMSEIRKLRARWDAEPRSAPRTRAKGEIVKWLTNAVNFAARDAMRGGRERPRPQHENAAQMMARLSRETAERERAESAASQAQGVLRIAAKAEHA